MRDPKHILQSKTFYANLLGPLFIWAYTKYGIDLDLDTQAVIIAVVMSLVNIGLRAVTNKPVTLRLHAK